MLRLQPTTLFLLPLSSVTAPLSTHAETKALTAEATYTMGDAESPSFAEAMVLQKAKQMALEQAGTYLESYTKVQNYQLTAEEIQTIAGGVLQVEVLEKTRSLVGDGLRFSIKIKATVTTDKMEELAQRIKGKNVAEDYKKLQEDYAKLTKELETWKQLVAKILPGPERDAALDQIREREKAFAGLQTNERSFFQRLVSGQELVHQADVERTKIDHLLQKFLEQGNDIEIGKISAYPVLQSRKDFQVTVPVTLKTTRSATSTLRDIASLLSTVVRSSVDMKFVGHLPRIGSKFQANAKGHLILLSDTSYRTHYYLKRLQDTKLTLELRSPDEHSLTSCAILGIERLLTAYHYEVTNDGTYNFHLGAQFFSPNSTILIEDGATVEVDFVLSESTVKKLGVVTAKFVFIESRDAIKPCTVC